MRKQVRRDWVTWMLIQQRQDLETRSWLLILCLFPSILRCFLPYRFIHMNVYFSCFSEVHLFCKLTHFCPCSWFSDTVIDEELPLKAFVNTIFQRRIKELVIDWSGSSSREKIRKDARVSVCSRLSSCCSHYGAAHPQQHTGLCFQAAAFEVLDPSLRSYNLILSSD